MVNALSCRSAIFIGAFLSFLGFFVSSFVSRIEAVVVCYGIIAGIHTFYFKHSNSITVYFFLTNIMYKICTFIVRKNYNYIFTYRFIRIWIHELWIEFHIGLISDVNVNAALTSVSVSRSKLIVSLRSYTYTSNNR